MTDTINFEEHLFKDQLAIYISSVWVLNNTSSFGHEIVLIPDGMIDMCCFYDLEGNMQKMLFGLCTKPEMTVIPPHSEMRVISFTPLGIEYLLKININDIVDSQCCLPSDFLPQIDFSRGNIQKLITSAYMWVTSIGVEDIEQKKIDLFDIVTKNRGNIVIKELESTIFWNQRQMNRYFNNSFGISLKKYCNVLRFYSNVAGVKRGSFFPDIGFSDQAHFIRETRKLCGVTPRELFQNKNDRFIQLSKFSDI
ncbi:helix-turn-helix domain-containing protein [Myroides profundi]|uniref:AraC-type DNA-binding protein n=1 Tax=Myroides profundi TaxID=480520 RepID=A0AAJ5BDB3_MYRPR|nr:AraC family transcriptional regulator [Myroides profundi]SEQ48341.1 AraC-type DNA-binding protein [Myroides profundi]